MKIKLRKEYENEVKALPKYLKQAFMDAIKEGKNIGQASEIAGVDSMLGSYIFSSQIKTRSYIQWQVD